MQSSMTPQERLKKTLCHQQPDRPLIQIDVTPEIEKLLQYHCEQRFATRNFREIFEIDFCKVGPRLIKPRQESSSGIRVYANEYGVYQDVVNMPLAWIKNMADVEQFIPYNVPDAYDFSTIFEQCRSAAPHVRFVGAAGMFDIVNGLGARGIGLEELLCGIMSENPVTLAMIDKHLDYDYEYLRRCLEAGKGEIEVLFIGEDCANQRGPIFPPQFFKQFFAPRLRRFIDLAHRYGAACMLHSCGSVRLLLPVFIDIGLDILDVCQPEPEGMDPEGLKLDFGKDITFCGMLSLQKTFPFGTVEECRIEAEHRINVIGKNGGYIFSSGNSLTKDVPIENIIAAYEVATGKILGPVLYPVN